MRACEETFANARRLRRELSLPEIVLWRALRRKALAGLRFRKQHPMGRCVLDFYLPSARLAVEVDGEAHERGDHPGRDARRDAWLATRGVEVLRFAARDVLDEAGLEGVLRAIADAAQARQAPSGRCAATSPVNGGGFARPDPPPFTGEGDHEAKPNGGGGIPFPSLTGPFT